MREGVQFSRPGRLVSFSMASFNTSIPGERGHPIPSAPAAGMVWGRAPPGLPGRPTAPGGFLGFPQLRGSSGAYPWPWARAGCRCTAPRRSVSTASPLLGYPLPGRERWGYSCVPRCVPPIPKDPGETAGQARGFWLKDGLWAGGAAGSAWGQYLAVAGPRRRWAPAWRRVAACCSLRLARPRSARDRGPGASPHLRDPQAMLTPSGAPASHLGAHLMQSLGDALGRHIAVKDVTLEDAGVLITGHKGEVSARPRASQ